MTDKVTPGLRQAIFDRDRTCVAAKLDKGHVCRGPLTIEHVKDEPMMGKRAPSDEWHCVALCYDANVHTVWGSAHRDLLRAYLAGANTWLLGEVS